MAQTDSDYWGQSQSGNPLLAREGAEGPRGGDNERPGDRQRRGGRVHDEAPVVNV